MKGTALQLKLSLILVFLSGLPFLGKSQSFEKGDKIIYGGIKISIYNMNDPDDKEETAEKDRAASHTIPVGFEYAISNRIGVGLELGFANFFTEKDTITQAIAEANSFDALLTGNFHWVRRAKMDLYSGLGVGFSNFKYKSNDAFNSHYDAAGPYFRIGVLNSRFYLSKAFFLGVNFGLPIMNFDSGRIKDDVGNDFEYRIDLSGWDLGANLGFKF